MRIDHVTNRAPEPGGEDVPELTRIASTFSDGIFYRWHLNEAPTYLFWQGKQDFRASLSGIQPRNSGPRTARLFALIRRRTQMNCFSAGNRLSALGTRGARGVERRTGRNRMSGSVADETGRSQATARANWPRTTRAPNEGERSPDCASSR